MTEFSNRERILFLFLECPTRQFQMREVSRLAKLGLPSVKTYLASLCDDGLISKCAGNVFPYFIANRENRRFRLLKINHWSARIEDSGLLEELARLYPDCIVLFGSCARGEDTDKSDLDIFVQAKRKEFRLEKFEKTLKHRINLLFEPDLKKIPNELKNNLANGVLLSGYLALF